MLNVHIGVDADDDLIRKADFSLIKVCQINGLVTARSAQPLKLVKSWLAGTVDRKIEHSLKIQPMKPSDALAAHRNEIRENVLSHRTSNARVFGSVVHGSDTEESDLDILVDTTEDTTLFDLGAIRYKLRNLLGVQVDVLTPAALPDKFRQIIIAEARPVLVVILCEF